MQTATLLGIETSCDDTAAAVVRVAAGGEPKILSNVVWTDFADHAAFGGVVPEIAARSHVERLDLVIERALKEAGLGVADLSGVAATAGPGLVGGVMVGLTAGKAIAIAADIPLIPVNHLEGHALSARLTEPVDFPYLLLLISGGHTQLIEVEALGRYRRLGSTIDDAAGEAFDKTAKLLDLGQPGGPRIESAAVGGRSDRFDLPKLLAKQDNCDFSFSGLKTAIRLVIEGLTDSGAGMTGQDVADIAASFQAAAARHLADRTARAMKAVGPRFASGKTLVVAGGVAANCAIKAELSALCARNSWRLVAPPAKYCTDNAAMIALAGGERMLAGLAPAKAEALSFAPRARWPLAPVPEGMAVGSGRKGPRA
ncbi:MAG: tRNA (adenosine(37)-N6)-threonylcarbamoyltransferase complex transferase subunit TsaD [Pseudomonadota bacterium]